VLGRQEVADKFFHYDVNGQGYLGHGELLQVSQDLHAMFNPGSGERFLSCIRIPAIR